MAQRLKRLFEYKQLPYSKFWNTCFFMLFVYSSVFVNKNQFKIKLHHAYIKKVITTFLTLYLIACIYSSIWMTLPTDWSKHWQQISSTSSKGMATPLLGILPRHEHSIILT